MNSDIEDIIEETAELLEKYFLRLIKNPESKMDFKGETKEWLTNQFTSGKMNKRGLELTRVIARRWVMEME